MGVAKFSKILMSSKNYLEKHLFIFGGWVGRIFLFLQRSYSFPHPREDSKNHTKNCDVQNQLENAKNPKQGNWP